MKKLFFASFLILTSFPSYSQEIYSININRVCAAVVGIPYGSDNFSDIEYQQFKDCLDFMKKYRESYK